MTVIRRPNEIGEYSSAIAERTDQQDIPILRPTNVRRMKIACFDRWPKDLDFVYDRMRGNNSLCKRINLIVLKIPLNISVVLRVKGWFTHQTSRS